MRAAAFEAFGGPIEVRDVPDPTPPADGVVVAVRATGLCRSDWHGWIGHDPDIRLPHVPGHELAGEVVAVGPAVARWRVGDRVTVPFVCGCGACPPCAAGNQQVCDDQLQPGFTGWGSFAELVAIHRADGNLVRLPHDMGFVTAASLGCRFATAFRALVDLAPVRAGEWVAIHGCGGVGLSAVMIAAACGASVVAIDLDADKLSLARRLGATASLDATGIDDVAQVVRDLTGGGPHVSVDALGSPATAVASMASLRTHGTHVQVGLLLGDERRVALPMDLVVAKELRILGSHGMQAHRYPAMLEMVRTGALDPHRLVGSLLTLDDVPTALPALGSFAGVGISVIEPRPSG